MAPKGVSNWRRPYTSIYNDNYRYGTGLYSDTLSDIEKRYSDSIGRTQLRADRGDLGFASFLGSALASSPNPGATGEQPATSPRPILEERASPLVPSGSTFESRLSSALHSAYASDEERPAAARAADRPKSLCLYDDASYFSLPRREPAAPSPAEVHFELPKSRRSKEPPTNGPTTSGAWRDKGRGLQEQLEQLEKSVSDSSGRLRGELAAVKSKCHAELSQLGGSLELSSQQAADLHKTVKRQASQLAVLQGAYDDSQRSLEGALQEMETWHDRCRGLRKEMDRLREELEQGMQKCSRV